jgi:hypothetical protein
MKNFPPEELRLPWNKFCRAVNTTKRINQKSISFFLYIQLKKEGLIRVQKNNPIVSRVFENRNCSQIPFMLINFVVPHIK